MSLRGAIAVSHCIAPQAAAAAAAAARFYGALVLAELIREVPDWEAAAKFKLNINQVKDLHEHAGEAARSDGSCISRGADEQQGSTGGVDCKRMYAVQVKRGGLLIVSSAKVYQIQQAQTALLLHPLLLLLLLLQGALPTWCAASVSGWTMLCFLQ
jgi:hypothetical protein